MSAPLKIRIYDRDGIYREVNTTYDQIADASMIIWNGKYYYFFKMDTTEGRIIGLPIFKEGTAPVDLTPDVKLSVASINFLDVNANAISALRFNQQQASEDGSMVTVSRQALEEVLAVFPDLKIPS